MANCRRFQRLPFLCDSCHDKFADEPLCPGCAARVAARNELALNNSGLVGYTVKRFFRKNPTAAQHYPHDDAFADGFIGLLRAAELFDESAGNRFATYASGWIMQSLARGWDKCYNLIHKPAYADSDIVMTAGHDREVFDMLATAEPALKPEIRELQVLVRSAINKLHHRHAYVILQRMKQRTLEDIANEMGLTRERVRQIEMIAKLQLSKLLRRTLPPCILSQFCV